MKQIACIIYVMFFSLSLSAQETDTITKNKKITFTQIELSLPLRANPNKYSSTVYDNKNETFFIPDGLCAKIGYGIHHNKWVGISIHTGIDWQITPKLVSAPVYGQLTINPLVGDETRLLFQAGFGHSFALGRGKLSGNYYKTRLGFTTSDDISLFVDASYYGFEVNKVSMGSISIGISLTSF